MKEERIRITLRSFNHYNLTSSCQKVLELVKSEKSVIKVSGPISFPTKKRIYCVLRSPHVDKDAREQFEVRRYKKIIEIYSTSQEVTKNLLKSEVSPGVFTQVAVANV